MAVQGGAAGSARGEGYVYCMKDGKQFKIGCSADPDDRLRRIQAQNNRAGTELLLTVEAREMNGAETAAQNRVMNVHGLRKITNTATDWFSNPGRATERAIEDTVRSAVYAHNQKQN